ncbi:MAG: ABC transporter substrate-binding protein [Bauldia sp.]|nr:ABC transporter substrate-binding protein [Bauldia sp.]
MDHSSNKAFRAAGLVAGVVLSMAIALPAAAQMIIAEPMRIGVIMPPVDPAAPAWEQSVARGAAQGALIAEDEFVFNAEMLGMQMSLVRATATTAEEAVAAATQLVEQDGVYAIIGGYDNAQAAAIGAWAEEANIPFVNVGGASDSLRNEACHATTFHLEPSAAMYIDAIAGWYVRAGFRRWYVVTDGSEESLAQQAHLTQTLQERHFGIRQVAQQTMAPGGPVPDNLVSEIARNNADFVLILMGAADQLAVMTALDQAGVDMQVTGFPYPETQTRAYFVAMQAAAPTIGTNNRVTTWEATLDAYGAREMNARYRQQFREPMDASAWATYQAVKILYEAAFFGGSLDPAAVVAFMAAPTSVFDVYKGIGTSFRPWDRQLRQTLFLDKISDEPVPDTFNMAILVGELPAIYMAGTDPVERLDQLGTTAAQSTCGR